MCCYCGARTNDGELERKSRHDASRAVMAAHEWARVPNRRAMVRQLLSDLDDDREFLKTFDQRPGPTDPAPTGH